MEKVLIEADSQIAFNALNRDELDSSSFGLVIDDYKLLVNNIKQCQALFVRRSANGVTHCLARATNFVSNQECWMSVSLPFISDVFLNDLI